MNEGDGSGSRSFPEGSQNPEQTEDSLDEQIVEIKREIEDARMRLQNALESGPSSSSLGAGDQDDRELAAERMADRESNIEDAETEIRELEEERDALLAKKNSDT